MITTLASKNSKNRFHKIASLSGLAIIPLAVFAVILITALNSKNAQNTTDNVISGQKTYQTKDKLIFTLDLGGSPELSMKTPSDSNYIKKVFAQTIEQTPSETESNLYKEGNLKISAELINTTTNQQSNIPLSIQKQQDSTYTISTKEENYSIIPGKYNLEVVVDNNGQTQTFTQDFTWGVLAINTNKSMYLPLEKAIIAMAVLDEAGEMVCNADVTLAITDPDGSTKILTTQDQTIKISPNCSKKEYIPTPDYEAQYTTNTTGTYKMELTAVTTNGSYSITDQFEVRDYVPFEIERTTATRIFPPVDYPVTITIKANEDFTGTIEEIVPKDFEIKQVLQSSVDRMINKDYNPNSSDAQLVQKIEIVQEDSDYSIIEFENKKIIAWGIQLKQGEEFQLQYVYRAPEISPEFYLLGPLTLKNRQQDLIFQETRKWQIAADAIAYSEASSGGSANVTSISATLTAAANSLVVFSCTVTANVTLTGPTGYNTLFTNSAANITHGTYYKISAGATESPSCSWTGSQSAAALILEYTGVESTLAQTLDTSSSATGSGDTTAECPSVTPSTGNHLYVATVGLDDDTAISTWSNSFSERVDYQMSTGNPGGRHTIAAADKISTGSQSTTATAGATVGWSCHMAAFNEELDIWNGRAFTDDDENTSLNSQSVCAVVEAGTPSCTTTDGSGYFTLAFTDALAGNELTFFLDGGTNLGNTKTITDGGDIVTADNLRVYQNHVVLRHEQGTDISITDIDLYDNDQNATDMLYDAETGPATLVVENPNELFVQSGYTFAPTGNVTAAHDIEIDGVWTAAASETVNLSGTYKLDSGGTLNPSTSTVTFDGTAATEDIITTGTGGFYNLTINDGGGSLTVEVEDPLTVYNNLTITGGTLDAKSGENNQINVGGNWDNDDIFVPRAGTVVMDGSGATTYTIDSDGSTTDDYFYNLTFNDSGGGSTYQISNLLDVNNNITITGGTLDSNGQNITVGGNWTNDDTFTESTNTVTFDVGSSSTIDSGCTDPSTCTNENFYNLVINKASGPGDVTLANTALRVTNSTKITQGTLNQGALNVQLEGTTALTTEDRGHWINTSTGNITLGGNVVNRGAITLNSNGISCGDADSITLTSTDTTQREWSGNGAFRITDVNVNYQSGSAVIYAASSTNGTNNGSNWIFTDCNILNIEGMDFEGVNIN